MAVGLAEKQKNPEVTVNTMVMGWLDKDCTSASPHVANITLTDSEANYAQIEFTGSLGGDVNIIVPTEAKLYHVYNNTTGAYTLTVKTTGGSPVDTGALIQQGNRAVLGCDGNYVNRYSNVEGMLAHNMASDADYTLSTAIDPQEWQYETVKITDTSSPEVLTATSPIKYIIVPTNTKKYIFINATAQTLGVKTSGGTGIAVATNKTAILYCDGTNVTRVTADV